MCNFRIGQKVVCVKPHPEGVVKKDEIYTIQAIKKESCKCGGIVVDVGVRDEDGVGLAGRCGVCGELGGIHNGIWWIYSSRFAPLQSDAEESDMNEALNEVFSRKLFA